MYAKTLIPDVVAPIANASRRGFLKSAGTAALVLGVYTRFGKAYAEEAAGGGKAIQPTPADVPMPNAFVRVAPDNSVTVLIKHLDMGQGVTTGLPTIVAEELDADWSQMRAEFAPANAQLYNNLAFGPIQGTGGSTAVANSWMQLRKAGAAARAMLVAAAAQAWKVPPDEITVSKGVISHAKSGKTGSFGEFAVAAAQLPVPASVKLKDPKDFVLIGTRVPRLDSMDKTDGKAVFALDIRRPNMLTAVMARPPRFGGTVKSVDDAAAKAIKGVVSVVTVPQGVAVLADNTWAAIQGRDALKIQWDEAQVETRSSADILADYKKAALSPGAPAVKDGDAVTALKSAVRVLEADFVMPYLAHAPMEPLNCTIEKTAAGIEVWAGAQFQTIEQATVAAILGTTPDKVQIHTVWAGGSFGRRATPNADYIAEAASIFKASGGERPVHLVWTREDDIKGGRYRPMFYHSVKAGLDKDGNVVGWNHRLVGQSFAAGTAFAPMMIKNGVDATAVEGVSDMPYAIPNRLVEWSDAPSPVTTLWWRSVGHSHTAQAVEVMVDDLAHASGKDPLQFRLDLLKDKPRHIGVLKLAAEKGNFGEKLGEGQGRGIAVHESFNTYVAMVVDVTVKGEEVKIDRIVAAVDCGIAINPDVIKAQMEGGAGYGLGAALRNEITFDKGQVVQSNFDTYLPLRISDMPKVEVHIVSSLEAPTGVGEPGVPPVAPAVSNAIFAATGKRLRSLPFNFDSLKGA